MVNTILAYDTRMIVALDPAMPAVNLQMSDIPNQHISNKTYHAWSAAAILKPVVQTFLYYLLQRRIACWNIQKKLSTFSSSNPSPTYRQ